MEKIIWNMTPLTIYPNAFEDKRFFKIVFDDENPDGPFSIRLAPRTFMEITWIGEKGDFEGLKIVKMVGTEKKGEVKFSKFNLAQLDAFVNLLRQINASQMADRTKLKIHDEVDEQTKNAIGEFLTGKDGVEIIENALKKGAITEKDIVNTAYRKTQVELFEKMMDEPDHWKKYCKSENIASDKEEKAWQHFLEKNPWILGFGLDYRYRRILQREAHLSDGSLTGKGKAITDFLLGDKRFTTFVELKTPSTRLFRKVTNRAGSWKLSVELMEAYSQVLEQKSSGQIHLSKKKNYDQEGNLINQKFYDSKVVIIIGSLKEEENLAENDLEWETKERTFELFRRDSRNIEVLTFDELLDRAKHIANR